MKLSIPLQLLAFAAALLCGQVSYGQIPQQLNYQGRVSVYGLNYNGTGQFKFALVDGGVNQSQSPQQAYVGTDPETGAITLIYGGFGGSGYTTPPAVTITGANGSGSGATAEAIVQTDGTIQQINLLTPGSGYQLPVTVTIAPPPPNIQYFSTWSNDQTSVLGSEPTAAVTLPVVNGLYSVQLGDAAAGMSEILPGVFHGQRYLRIWFSHDGNDFQQLTPDQPLGTAPYAFRAIEATGVVSGGVTSDMIAESAVTQSKIATGAVAAAQIADGVIDATKITPGSLTVDRINVTGSPTVGNVLSFGPGGSLAWAAGASNGSGWALSGNAGAGSGSFLGTLDNTPLAFRINNEEVLRLDTNTDLVLPSLPEISGNSGANGLGTYVFNSGLFGTTFGRTFGGADIDGPVLYGQKGGGLGIKKQFAGNFGFTEKTILNWREGIINVYSDSGFSISPADTPMITRAFDPFTVGSTNKYHGHGRWGMFMEPSSLNIGIPSNDVGVRSFTVSRYDANGARWNLCQIENNSGKFSVNGLGQELAYLGGDGNGDVEFGSLNGEVTEAVFFNPTSNQRLNIHARDAHVRQLTIYGGMDLAEPFVMSHDNVEPGSVVVIDEENPGKLRVSRDAYDKKVAGIVSGADGIRPGISMIQEDMLEAGENVALSGRVYVKSNNSAGDIQPGDLLTTSAIPGEAMKASDHNRSQGAILGKAMTQLSDASGKVLVLVTLQ